MNLYQFSWDAQPHYVVAMSYADAEKAIRSRYGSPKKIENLGPYVLLSQEIQLQIFQRGPEEK